MKETRSAIKWLANTFFTHAEPFGGFSEEEKWVITEADFDRLIEYARKLEEGQSEGYAEFAIQCDREGMNVLKFKDYMKHL